MSRTSLLPASGTAVAGFSVGCVGDEEDRSSIPHGCVDLRRIELIIPPNLKVAKVSSVELPGLWKPSNIGTFVAESQCGEDGIDGIRLRKLLFERGIPFLGLKTLLYWAENPEKVFRSLDRGVFYHAWGTEITTKDGKVMVPRISLDREGVPRVSFTEIKGVRFFGNSPALYYSPDLLVPFPADNMPAA